MGLEPQIIQQIRVMGLDPSLSTSQIAQACGVSWETANRWRSLPKQPSLDVQLIAYPEYGAPCGYARALSGIARREAAQAMFMCPEKLGRLERGEQDARGHDLIQMVGFYGDQLQGITGDDLLGLGDLRRFPQRDYF